MSVSSDPGSLDQSLLCLRCRASTWRFDDGGAYCLACGNVYPATLGILDTRNADRDRSVGFDLEDDLALANKMLEVFPRLNTFNEMLRVWVGLYKRRKTGINYSDIDMTELIAEDDVHPVPLTNEQRQHGAAILKKVPGYVRQAGMPPLSKGGTALEDGAGHGLFIGGFSAHFDRLFVIDLSLPYLMLAAKMVEELRLRNVHLICASAEWLPFTTEAFDFVHSNNVIEHVARQDLLISEAHRVLKATGLFFLMSPNRFSLYFEPHFRLPGFGFFPKWVSRPLIRKRQARDISDISLLSLSELRALLPTNGGRKPRVSFVPNDLSSTATGGVIRKVITHALRLPGVGKLSDAILNRLLLGVMPYHVVVMGKADRAALRSRAPDTER